VSRGPDAGERLRRLLAIMPWLASRGTATFEEIGERFGMDVATVENELLLAACCGLPPYSPDQLIELVVDEHGVTANVPDYFRRPLQLTAADGFAMLAAGQGLLAVPGADEARSDASGSGKPSPLASALDKLADVLGGPRGVAVELDAPPLLADLRSAAAEAERVEVDYYSASRDEVTTRAIDPFVVFAERGHWYVSAYCHRADAVLNFRVDRVRSARPTGERFERPDPTLAAVPGAVFRPGPDMEQATVVLPAAARWVVETYPTTSVEELPDGSLRVVLPVSGRAWLERVLLRVGPEARVEGPPELADVGRQAAARVLARYAGATG
jgi:proteasome accessory factor C